MEHKETCEVVATGEKEYWENDAVFVKRNLRPDEYITTVAGNIYIPRAIKERMENEAAALKFIAETTNIPVPRVLETFEKDGAFYIVMEKVPGVTMAKLGAAGKEIVMNELQGHLQTLHSLRSNIPGGISGLIVPPYRVTKKTENDSWKLKPAMNNDFVFCHNDLSQHNVIVDPESLQINAIIDWEYSGFYPEYFEGPFYTRPGPSGALGDEKDDTEKLLSFLLNQSVE